MYLDFRFRKVENTSFTMFYNMFGDSLFDTLYPGVFWYPFFMTLYIFIGVQFAVLFFRNIALAMIEEGYVLGQHKRQFDWLIRPENLVLHNEAREEDT